MIHALPKGETGLLQTPDGAQIRYCNWPGKDTDNRNRGTLVFLTGMREFIDKYAESLNDLMDHGFRVCAMDWRGQGLSTRPLENRQKIHVESFDQHVADLTQFMEDIVLPGTEGGPLLLFAHSMGGHLALRYLHDHADRIDGAFLCSPMCDIWDSPVAGKILRGLARMAGGMGARESYFPGRGDYDPDARPFEVNRLTSDPERFKHDHQQIAANADLAMGGPTIGWVCAALDSVDVLMQPDYLARITCPVFIVQAGADQVVNNAAQDKAAELLPDSTLIRIEGAKHELLRERDNYRDQLWQGFEQFLEKVGRNNA